MNFQDFKNKYQKVRVETYPNSAPNAPLISVCVQTYQHEKYIKQCLDGILMQEVDFEYEILLGEDASTDRTREICKEYANKHPNKIKLFLHNRGNNISIGGKPTGRFNFLYNLYSANGKYIAICEGDDYWNDPLKLKKQIDHLEKYKSYSICWTRHKIFWEEKKYFSESFGNRFFNSKLDTKDFYDITLEQYLQLNPVQTASCVFRKDKFDFEIFSKTNFITSMIVSSVLLSNGKGVILNRFSSVYRKNNESLWTGMDNIEKGKLSLKMIKNLELILGKKKSIEKYKQRTILLICQNLLIKRRFTEFFSSYFSAFLLNSNWKLKLSITYKFIKSYF